MNKPQDIALAIVEAICKERQDQHKVPETASLTDITQRVNAEVQTALEELVASGHLCRTENINRIPMYNPKQHKNE